MKLVVDSSVVVKWFVDEPQREAAASLLDVDDLLLAPDIVLAEVANSLWRKARTGEVEFRQVEEAIRELPSLLVLHPLNLEITIEALAIAGKLEHSVYDCLFLALANGEKAELVTADLKFFAKVTETGLWTNIRQLTF